MTRQANTSYLFNMVFCARIIQTGAVWLTALMTLAAGTPHFECRCPNGRIKPFCLALFSGKTGCCCGGSCCSVIPGDEDKALAAAAFPSSAGAKKTCCCCCKAPAENAGSESRTASRFEKVGCRKTLAEAAVAIPVPFVKAPVQDATAHLFVPAPEPTMEPDGFGACDCLPADYYHWPPPTDLVTVLQRFLI